MALDARSDASQASLSLKHCDGQGFEQGKLGNFEFEISMDDVKMWVGGQCMHICALYILG